MHSRIVAYGISVNRDPLQSQGHVVIPRWTVQSWLAIHDVSMTCFIQDR